MDPISHNRELSTPRHSRMPLPSYRSCDLCGSQRAIFILNSPGLDGPLIECTACRLRYIGTRRSNLTFGKDAHPATVSRIKTTNVQFNHLRLEEYHRLAALNALWRLKLIQGFLSRGRLLEVGCGRGDFLKVAKEVFEVYGVEPNSELRAEWQEVAAVYEGVIDDVPWSDFDVAATFHVIEHVDSPSRFITEIARRLRPGGLLVIETPNIASLPFRLFKQRWRQFIPEHYYFFEPQTVKHLLSNHGFTVQKTMAVGKYASVELVLNRLARYSRLAARADSVLRTLDLTRLTLRLNPLDIMLVFATKSK